MAELPKVLYDDHHRMERMFSRFNKTPSPDLLTGVVDEVDICLTTSEELAVPVVARVNPSLAAGMEAEQQKIRDLAAEVTSYEWGDPELMKVMKRFERAVLVHISHNEAHVLPLLRSAVSRDELYELGRNAFTLRQEMLGQLDFRPRLQPLGMPGNGWGSGRLSLNAGW